MPDSFITDINVFSSRNVKDLKITLSNEKRQHLILTGRNGSGKTSLLHSISKFLHQIEQGHVTYHPTRNPHIKELKKQQDRLRQDMSKYPVDSDVYEDSKFNINHSLNQIEQELQNIYNNAEDTIRQIGDLIVDFSIPLEELISKFRKGEFLIVYFPASRNALLTIPTGVQKFSLEKQQSQYENVNSKFLQYLVNLKAERSFARDDDEMETVEIIDEWFLKFERRLRMIFEVDDLELKFNRKSYVFTILTPNSEPFTFDTLSAGFSAVISIVSELLLRMEAHQLNAYTLEGIVFIDEIETHLHVDLQKKILPFLIDFFPNIQFIVTTHSPFVLSSVSNATICDLQTRIVTTDLSSYSYDAILESYFNTDKYSEELKDKLEEYDQLIQSKDRTDQQTDRLKQLKDYFKHAPKYLSTELYVRLQQIRIKELDSKA